MSRVYAGMAASLASVWRGLREPRLYLLLLLVAALWAAAYQYKTEYTVDLGGRLDDAYVSGFHAKERNPQLDYRWSGDVSRVRFPAVGNQPVVVSITTVGHRPEGASPPVEITVRGERFAIQTAPEPKTETFFVGRGDPWDGDVAVEISSPTFTPPGDPRNLGVIVDTVTLASADMGLRPVVVPPVGALALLLLGLVLTYAIVLATLRERAWALAAAGVLGLLVTLLVVVARTELGLFVPGVVPIGLWGLAFGLGGRVFLDWSLTRHPEMERAAAWGSLAFALAFLIRFGGLTYPQFLTSDIMLHVNNILSVLGGEWVFPEHLPDGTPVPYPNALYVILAPLAVVTGPSGEALSVLLKWSGALFDSLTCLGLAWAGARVASGRVGAAAALAYSFSPAPLPLFSAGNYTNIFGQAALSLTLLAGMVFLARRTRLGPVGATGLLAVGFSLTLLGHYGIMLAALAILAFFALWVITQSLSGRRTGPAWAVLGASGAALLISFLLYYRHFTEEMWAQWSGVAARLMSGSSGAGGTSPGRVGSLVSGIGRRVSEWLGTLMVLCGLYGGGLLGTISRPARALLLSWLAACIAFALLDQALGDAVRWYYLAAAPVSFLAGLFLAPMSRRGGHARLLAGLVILTVLVGTAQFWVGDLIFTRYH